MSVWIILAAIAVLGFSGFPACLFSSRRAAGQWLTTLIMLLGSGLGLSGVVMSLNESTTASMCAAWFLPWGRFAVAIDPLSVLFLLPVFVVPALGSIYGLGYWKQSEHQTNGRRLGLFYGLLAGAMALVTIARDGVLFLIAWEVMAIAAYFAATAEDDNPEVRRAGWVYLIATHVGTLCLIAMFALWNQATGSFALSPTQGVSSELAGALFILAVIGFGFKAGLMPLHVWLPGAHANAPSHVSAVMSGVMLKMGRVRYCPNDSPAAGPGDVVGRCPAGRGGGYGDCGHCFCYRSARPEAPAGLQQHRKYRYYCDGAGSGDAGPHPESSRLGPAGVGRGIAACLESQFVQIAAVFQCGRDYSRCTYTGY
jgi:formate hydrogenlyase subunit 3/multisubunit Na+/H+ antiporter MnhD subunit